MLLARESSPAQSLPPQSPGKRVEGILDVYECEGVNNCADWRFDNDFNGAGKWPTWEQANLRVTKSANGEVVSERSDVFGALLGVR